MSLLGFFLVLVCSLLCIGSTKSMNILLKAKNMFSLKSEALEKEMKNNLTTLKERVSELSNENSLLKQKAMKLIKEKMKLSRKELYWERICLDHTQSIERLENIAVERELQLNASINVHQSEKKRWSDQLQKKNKEIAELTEHLQSSEKIMEEQKFKISEYQNVRLFNVFLPTHIVQYSCLVDIFSF